MQAVRRHLILLLLLCILDACVMKPRKSAFFNERQSGISRVPKAMRQQIAGLPPTVSNAVFEHYTRYNGWPFSIEEALVLPEATADWKQFKQQGMDWTRLLYRSRDSLVIGFSFDVQRYASVMGRSGKPYPAYFEGAYYFLRDTQFRLVKVEIEKYSKLQKRYK